VLRDVEYFVASAKQVELRACASYKIYDCGAESHIASLTSSISPQSSDCGKLRGSRISAAPHSSFLVLLIDEDTRHDNFSNMSYEETNRITKAYNKILAVVFDPDVQDVFGENFFWRGDTLPEIQLDDIEPKA
jgi:hypothetical protein